mmetsp:Transcript_2126/g.3466  ORF Transcript_2126/g.3466 Transcript_2126/m.3466 type:complete len:322 (-) Transcript_2126:104-1069(-)
MSLRAYLRESLYVPRLSPPSLYRLFRVAASVLRTILVSAFSSFSLPLDFLSFLGSFLAFLSDFFSSFFSSFLAAFSLATSSSADLKEFISSRAHRISRTSASLAPTVPWRRSQTAKCSILIMRWILPLCVSQVVSCKALRVRRLESFWRSRSWSLLSFSAALDSLMESAVFLFFSFPFFPPPPPPFPPFFPFAAAAAGSSVPFPASMRRRSFSSCHLIAGSKIEPAGGAISRRIKGIEERWRIVMIFFLVSRSKVLSKPSRYINADFSTQYTSKVRSLNKRSLSASPSAAAAAAEDGFTGALFALAALAALAWGAGTKDMH